MGSQRSKTIGDWPVIEVIEPRLLFSAGWNVALIDGSLPEADQLVCAAAQADLIHVYDGSSETAAEVLSHVSALAQAAEMKIDSVSILSHGRAGAFALGNEWISSVSLPQTTADWSELGSALSDDSVIQIYGCGVADGTGQGQMLIDLLASLTGASVFASDDLTGFGGDWVLEAASSGADAQAAGIVSAPFDIHMLTEWGGTLDVAAGTESLVNTVTANDQQASSVAMDDDGNFVIVWQSKGQDHLNKFGVYAQLFDANGVAQGGEFLVNTTTVNDQNAPSVAMDDSGNFVIAWESTGQDDPDGKKGVYAQLFDANGVAQGGEFLVNTATDDNQLAPSVAMDDIGNFVIAWQSKGQDGLPSKEGVYAQRYNASGVAQGGEFLVNTTTDDNQLAPSVAMDDGGNFVIAWQSKSQDGQSGKSGVYAQRYNASGVAQGGEFLVNTTTADDQNLPTVAMADGGNFVIAWESTNQDSADNKKGVYAQLYDASGVAQGGEFLVNTTTADHQQAPSVAMDADGDFVIAWESTGQDNADGKKGVYAQRDSIKPVATTTGVSLSYTEDDGAVAVDAGITVTDTDDTNLESATITISGGYVNGQDTLAFTDQLGITGSWDAAGGVLSLTGSSSVANYQTALRSITYTNSSQDPDTTTRTVTFIVNDGDAGSDAATRDVTIAAVNDSPVVNNQSFNVDENSGNGTSVGTAIASDPEAGDSLTYSITAGNTGNAFAINSSTGQITVNSSAALDFETNPTFDLTVQIEDTGTLTDDATVTIDLNDLSEASTTILSTEQVWAWFSYQSQMEATPSSTPSTTEAAETYSITGGDDDAFATDSSAGETTASDQAALDSEADSSWELAGQVEGSEQDTGDATGTTGLNDGNEQTAIDDQGLANIAANAAKPGGPVEPKRGKDRDSQKAAIRKAARGRVAESSVIAKLARGIKQMMAKSPSVIELARGLNQITESPAFAGLSQGLNQILAESSTIVEAIRTNLPMRRQLESMKRKMARAAGLQKRREKIIVGTTTGATISFAAGYVIWTCRGGSMLASFLSAMPMWKWFDPLPVLSSWGKNHKQRKSDKHKASANDSDDVKNLFESKGRA